VTNTVRIYDVPAISCGHCQSAIEAEVATVPGVDSVAVDIAARTVRVEGAASDEAVRAAIDAAGYDVADPPGGG
jgi:copper chaperone